jgi:hypothetical protein
MSNCARRLAGRFFCVTGDQRRHHLDGGATNGPASCIFNK